MRAGGQLPVVQQRDSGVYKTLDNMAQAATGDPEQAAEIGHTALAIARETGSTPIYAEFLWAAAVSAQP